MWWYYYYYYYILVKDIYCPTYNKPERPGITESIKSLKHNEINVKIISSEAMKKLIIMSKLKTLLELLIMRFLKCTI